MGVIYPDSQTPALELNGKPPFIDLAKYALLHDI